MGCTVITGFIIYLNLDKNFSIHRSQNDWFDEYNHFLSIKDKHTTGSLLLQQDSESLIHHLDLLKFIPCELDLTYTPFCIQKFSYGI